MPNPSTPDFSAAPSRSEQADRFSLIIARATLTDGQPPFSDQSLVDVRNGRRRGIPVELDGMLSGFALLTTDTMPFEAEFVVAPEARHRGLGGQLLKKLLEETHGKLLLWAHGDHPDARALAARYSLAPVRELLQLRLDPVRAVHVTGEQSVVTSFRPGFDDAEWLALNALAFADHAEQGKLTQHDLDERIAESWFDRDDFLIARNASGKMTAFCWLKIEKDVGNDSDIGEFYAVGVSPDDQGSGLGRRLMNAGLARLESRGIRTASLYVEADNVPAVALYRSIGFADHSIDIQYAPSAH